MRLIDADVPQKDFLEQSNTFAAKVQESNNGLRYSGMAEAYYCASTSLKNAPTVNAPCWCKDCKWYDEESEVCVNPDSDWCADFPPQYGSCEHCEWRDDK